jgi:hypothetical protein
MGYLSWFGEIRQLFTKNWISKPKVFTKSSKVKISKVCKDSKI